MDEEETEGNTWKTDSEYTDYEWHLGHIDDGKWDIVTHGY